MKKRVSYYLSCNGISLAFTRLENPFRTENTSGLISIYKKDIYIASYDNRKYCLKYNFTHKIDDDYSIIFFTLVKREGGKYE